MIYRIQILLILSAILLLITVISLAQETTPEPAMNDGITDRVWTLTHFGQANALQPVLSNTDVTLTFDTSQATAFGSDGCNSYSGSYTMTGQRLSFGERVSTLMACLDDRVMQQADAFHVIMNQVTAYRLSGNQLHLIAGDDRLVFAMSMSLSDTDWTLLAYGSLDQPQLTLPDSDITLRFDSSDGQVYGASGCNTYFGRYETSDDTHLTISAIGLTRMACEESLMSQEQHYIELLQNDHTISDLDEGFLKLVTEDVKVLYFAPQSAPDSLVRLLTVTQTDEHVRAVGLARGLFEGTVTVELHAADGTVLATLPTIANGEDVALGGIGVFEIEFERSDETLVPQYVYAYATSPEDGATLADDMWQIILP